MPPKENLYHRYWVSVNISNMIQEPLTIKNVQLTSGLFYKGDDKTHEIPTTEIEGRTISSMQTFKVNSVARDNSQLGIAGSFEVYRGALLLRKISWHLAWFEPKNKFFKLDGVDPQDMVVHYPGDLNEGIQTFGNVNVDFTKKPPADTW